MGLRPGEKFQVVPYDGRIEFIPVRKMKTARGFLKGMSSRLERQSSYRSL